MKLAMSNSTVTAARHTDSKPISSSSPKQDFALAILTNSDDGGIITANAIGWALDLYFNAKAAIA